MVPAKPDIIAQLKREILSLQSFKRALNSAVLDMLPGVITDAFPNAEFPAGIHEFISPATADAVATYGFVSGLLSSLMLKERVCIWITSSLAVFPNALASFGITPDKVVFVHLQKEKDIMWATEEALKLEGLAAVIAETRELSFTVSRRLQLAVEQSRVTGFILRHNPRKMNTTACVTRWRVTSLPGGGLPDDMPGVGFPRWNVELLKVRNGKPGAWQIEFADGRLRPVYKTVSITPAQKKKTG